MKVTVTKYLNVRVGKPSLNAPCYQYLAPGSIIEVDEELYSGEKEDGTYEGNNKWYKDAANNYYWSGGFESQVKIDDTIIKKESEIERNFTDLISVSYDSLTKTLKKGINYHELIEFPAKYKLKNGKNTTIGLLDFPIKKYPSLFGERIVIDNFDIKAIHSDHGTQLASIIGASYTGEKYFKGIAAECNILQLPILHKHNGVALSIASISKFIKDNFPDGNLIINASLKHDNITKEINDFYDELSKEYIIVASAGEDEELFDGSVDKLLQFPSRLENVIAVGAISENFLIQNDIPKLNKNLDLVLRNFQYLGVTRGGDDKFDLISHDSAATAVVSGVLSLVASSIGNDFFKKTKQEIIEILMEGVSPYSLINTNKKFQILNPKS